MDATEKLHLFMDETSRPYEDGENPFVRTKEDEEFEKMLIEKYHLITKEMEESKEMGESNIGRTETRIDTYNGFYTENEQLDGRRLRIVYPDKGTENGHWVLKTEYFEAFPAVQLELLKQGYYLVHIENKTRWHVPEDTEARARLVEYMHENYGLEKKCSIIGMSCGGMQGIYFASKYPEYVSCMYLDAPVVNFLSCPAGLGKAAGNMFAEFQEATGMSLTDLLSYRNHPLDHVERLAELNIPIILVCGDSDSVVPYDENGKLLADAYKEKNSLIRTIVKENCDHHPHSLEDNTPIIEFINTYSK